jgi:hypothetical protein
MLWTLDGFQTGAVGNDQVQGNWFSAFSFAPANSAASYFYSSSSSQSLNYGQTYTSAYSYTSLDGGSLGFVWYPTATTLRDGTYGLVIECNFTNKAFKTNNVTRNSWEITALMSNALGNDVPCSAETYNVAGSTWRVRAISRTGWLATSDDDATTFAPVMGATGGLSSCDRKVTSAPSDRSSMVTWCGNTIHTSRNGGVTWTPLGLNWQRFGCGQPTSLAATPTKLLVTCQDRPPVLVDY